MPRRSSLVVRSAALAAPALWLVPAWTAGAEERAPCPAAPPLEVADAPAFRAKTATAQWSIGEPTAEEQQLLELMNRARMNPADEGDRIFVDYDSPRVKQATDFFLKQRPGVEYTRAENRDAFHGYAARPPLAFSGELIDSARFHCAMMKKYDQQSHQIADAKGDPLLDGSGHPVEADLPGRVVAAGYSGTFLAESVFAHATDMLHAHAGFAIDYGQPTQQKVNGVLVNCNPDGRPCLGHRLNLMAFDGDPGRAYREVGVGVLADADPKTSVGPRLVTIDFAIPTDPSVFVTGVVYDDVNGNGFYDPGEGIGGVRIDIDVGGTFAVTSASGGYAIPVTGSPGAVHVTATGAPGTPGEFVGTQTVVVDVTTENVKADFNRPPDPPVPPLFERTSASAAQPITDSAPTLSPIDVNVPLQAGDSSLVGDVEVEVAIDHPARQELALTLTPPSGAPIALFAHGAPGANLRGVFDATLAPAQSLGALVGDEFLGTWTLRVDDGTPGNDGTLNAWKLRVRPKWVRPLFASASPLFVTKFAWVDSKKPAGDSISLQATIDAGRVALGALAAPTLVVRDASGAALFTAALPAATIKRAIKGTSKTTVSATLKKLDLPALPNPSVVTIELALDDAVVSETVQLKKNAFAGAPSAIASPTLHVDTLATKLVAGVPTYTMKGRFAGPGALVGAGTLDVVFGPIRIRDAMARATVKGKVTTYKAATAVKSLVIDAAKQTFTLVVATSSDVKSASGAIDVSLRLGDDGFFGKASIVPAGSASSPTY